MLQKHFIFICLFTILLSSNIICAQNKVNAKTTVKTPSVSLNKAEKEKPYTHWSLRTGGNLSVIYLTRNIKEKNNEPGYCGGFIYEINNFIRVSALYTHFQPINIKPTWLDVKANTVEANLEILARFPNNKTLLYPFVGISFNTFKGFFTGESDYLGLREYYAVNSAVKNQWLGLNLGTGIEHNFGILGLFLDYRMRIGRQEKAINIMDVCYTAGIKVRFPYGKLAKRLSSPSGNDRFHWF